MSFDYDGDAISGSEWLAEYESWDDVYNEDCCPYCGCELELSFIGMKCPNPNCEFDEVEF